MISVIIAVYNGEPYIGEAIESVLEQTLPADELIVVDDGSTDATPQTVQRFGDAVRYERRSRAGFAAGRNRGVELSAGDYLAFLDADDRFVPGKLALQLEALRADPALDAVIGHVRAFISPDLRTMVDASAHRPYPRTT